MHICNTFNGQAHIKHSCSGSAELVIDPQAKTSPVLWVFVANVDNTNALAADRAARSNAFITLLAVFVLEVRI